VAFDAVALLFTHRRLRDLPLAPGRAFPFVVERDTTFYQRREIVDALALVCCVLVPDQLSLVTALRSSGRASPTRPWFALAPGVRARGSSAGGWRARASGSRSRRGRRGLPDDVRHQPSRAGTPAYGVLPDAGGIGTAFERQPTAVRRQLRVIGVRGGRRPGIWARPALASLDRSSRPRRGARGDGRRPRAVLSTCAARWPTSASTGEAAARRGGDAVRDDDHKARASTTTSTCSAAKGGGRTTEGDRVGAPGIRWEYRLCGVTSLGFHVFARRRRIERHERVRLLYVALTRARQRRCWRDTCRGRRGSKTFADLWALRSGAAFHRDADGGARGGRRRAPRCSGASARGSGSDPPPPATRAAQLRCRRRAASRRASPGCSAADERSGGPSTASLPRTGPIRVPWSGSTAAKEARGAGPPRRGPRTASRGPSARRACRLDLRGRGTRCGRHRFGADLEASRAAVGPEGRAAAQTRALAGFDRFCAGPPQRLQAGGMRAAPGPPRAGSIQGSASGPGASTSSLDPGRSTWSPTTRQIRRSGQVTRSPSHRPRWGHERYSEPSNAPAASSVVPRRGSGGPPGRGGTGGRVSQVAAAAEEPGIAPVKSRGRRADPTWEKHRASRTGAGRARSAGGGRCDEKAA
jgi:hypothetical protein